jgi:hypothetical protein
VIAGGVVACGVIDRVTSGWPGGVGGMIINDVGGIFGWLVGILVVITGGVFIGSATGCDGLGDIDVDSKGVFEAGDSVMMEGAEIGGLGFTGAFVCPWLVEPSWTVCINLRSFSHCIKFEYSHFLILSQ